MKAWALYNVGQKRLVIGSMLQADGSFDEVVSITPGEIERAYERTFKDDCRLMSYKILEVDTDTGEYRVLDSPK